MVSHQHTESTQLRATPEAVERMHAAPDGSRSQAQEVGENLHKLTDLPFKVTDTLIEYMGPMSVSQYDRFRYIAQVADVVFRESYPKKDSNERYITIESANPIRLASLASVEDKRRSEAAEAEQRFSTITGADWCWDGLCLSLPHPGDDPANSINKAIVKMKYTGAIKGAYGIVKYDVPEQGGGTQSWLTVHDFNIERLRELDKTSSPTSGRG